MVFSYYVPGYGPGTKHPDPSNVVGHLVLASVPT
jgi:hypothetical protein